MAERKAVFGYTEAWFFEESSLMTWLVISLQHYHWSMEILFLMGLLTSWGDKTSFFFFFFRNWKQREMCVRKDSTENLWLPLNLTTSESITISLEWILLVRLISRSVSFFLFFFFWIRVWKWWLSRVPGDVPSMECIQQQQDGTDANNTTQDEGVTPLPKVDSLDEAVYSRKTISQSVHFTLNWFQHSSLWSHIFFCCHSNAYCLFY